MSNKFIFFITFIMILLICLPISIHWQFIIITISFFSCILYFLYNKINKIRKTFTTKTLLKNSLSNLNDYNKFEQFYNNLYRKNNHILEILRKNTAWQFFYFFITIIVSVISGINIIFWSVKGADTSPATIFIISLIGLIILFIFLSHTIAKIRENQKKYVTIYKEEIIANIIKQLNPTLSTTPHGDELYNIRYKYKEAKFEPLSEINFCISDYIEGFLNKSTPINIYDINVERINYTNNGKIYTKVFEGLFAIVDCNKNINTYIKISKNKILNNFNEFKMDNSNFEKIFDIISSDKILAMRILTSDTMECLIDFYNQYKIDFEIVIKNDTIYLRFFTGPMFEPKIFSNSMNKELLFMYYSILKFVLELTNKISSTIQELDV